MTCLNRTCGYQFVAHDHAELAGYGEFIEIVATCPTCGQGYYTSIPSEELILDESRPPTPTET